MEHFVIRLSAAHVIPQSGDEVQTGTIDVNVAGFAELSHNSNLVTYEKHSNISIH